MRRPPFLIPSLLALLLALPAVAADQKTADGWPSTREGALARRWVEAFSKGEKAMRATLPEILAKEALAKTGMDERMERYRALHDKLGSLMLVKIEKSAPGELVALLATSEMEQLSFTFKAQTQAPFKLLAVTIAMNQRQGHGQGGGFHH
ncbi:MAG TPA: hypothetical protein VFQ05_13760 [Candidatus Eisenbacteria bacterium]|nr:hypothetical protein [Candidatus Eisenbacteria bacterium]